MHPTADTAALIYLQSCGAAGDAGRYPATDTKRGRPAKWKCEDLLRVSARLGDILDRETSSQISFASFVDHYLWLLEFPSDGVEVLENGEINLFEAEQFSRVTAGRLGVSTSRAKRTRSELLSSHLQTKASGERLRRRVNELLRASDAESGESINGELAAEIEDLKDFDPYDSTHLFWEQLKQHGFAFREIRREDVTDEEIEELLKASEPILAILSRIRRRKEQSKVIKVKL